MSQDPLKYLQQDNIGKVIAKGLASVYNNKPQRPIKYLAQWLKSYSNNKKQLSKVLNLQVQKQKNKTIFQQNIKLIALSQQQVVKKNKQRDEKIKQFQKMISKHQYQQQLLHQVFPQFIEKFAHITGAYIGQLNYPPKNIQEEDTDENAHMNMQADKVINYIGSSASHKNLMRGKILKLTEGVTAKAFQLTQEQSAPVIGQDGQQKPKQPKQKYIYIPNVVKNQSMHYFRIPKLGAYLAVPMVCKSYLKQKIFDQVLQEKKKQINQLNQFSKKKLEQLEQFNTTKQELKKKINQLRQKRVDQAQIQPISNQLKQLQQKIIQKQIENYQPAQINLNFIKNSYVICVDNLGKDQQLKQQDIKFIVNLVEHFKTSWQQKQKQLLFKDISTQIQYLKNLPSPAATIKSQFQKLTQPDQQTLKTFNQIQDQFLKSYKIQQQELKRKKQQLKNNKIYLQSFLKLKQFRVIKYKQLIQNILYFLSQTKDKINIPNQTILNWKHVKNHYITKQTFDNILNYIVHGPKQKNFKFYSKISALQAIFQKLNHDEIFTYNIGLGGIIKFITKALKHRVSNIKLRKAQKQAERIKRKQLIDQNTNIDILKGQQLKKHKDTLLPQDVQGFKQEQWINNFEKAHPKHQVPAQVIDDIDNDL